MICTLDRLYERLEDIKDKDKDFLKRLEYKEHLEDRLKYITFSVIDMGAFGLGEELYIKLNARGKALSKFENLKAFIEQQTSIPHELLSAIDNKWSDYFFDATQPKTFDLRFFHFLHYANAFFILDGGTGEKLEAIFDTKCAIDKKYTPLRQEMNLYLLDRVVDVLPKWDGLREKRPKLHTDQVFFHPQAKRDGQLEV
ncbi:hypothetical protein NHP190003_14350 [Helicobacter sp. NHP19-003]|uniref:Uncharacterized protein n=1 Tax=Helicobacter gastrocanis TaxID=2849641 RepID=A0ABM7SCM8_9HELI|nr:hypothetical protein [Helicobacter sp. NHP19-003]BCZ18153.1 hypothetical protein NHP190003_14350 [Helicobacter sp. NHP19-003]